MKVLIIEDEFLAADRMEELVQKHLPSADVQAKLPSVRKSVAWLKEHGLPDLIFMDVQLEDGLSFEIFEAIKVTCPIVFTTAFDAYAIKAFKVNSVDYLLKPIEEEELKTAIAKWKSQTKVEEDQESKLLALLNKFKPVSENKERFLVKFGDRLQSIEVQDILCFTSREKTTFIIDKAERTYVYDEPLDKVEVQISKSQFFRVNRNFIVSMGAIQSIYQFTNSRLKLELSYDKSQEVIVSRERVPEFKVWLGK